MMTDFREILRFEMDARVRSNPRYSMRAFARDLELAPSRLCEILSGKQGLSRKGASHLADRLGMAETQKSHFCDLVEARHARSPRLREQAKQRLAENRDVMRYKIAEFRIQLKVGLAQHATKDIDVVEQARKDLEEMKALLAQHCEVRTSEKVHII